MLALLLLATFLLSTAWALATPIPSYINGAEWGDFHPDEFSHAAVIRYMATRHALPPYLFPYDTSVHPPLYHGLAALFYAALTPLFGDAGALRTIRVLTALCGVGVVHLTVNATRHLAPGRTALLAGALVALVPMRVAIAGSLNNENLAALGATGALATIVGGLFDAAGFTRRRLVTLALYLVIGIGSKVTCLGLLLGVAIALFVAARPVERRLTVASAQFLVLMAAIGAAWGPYFARNVRLYGDPLRRAAADRLWSGVQPGYSELSARQHISAGHYAIALASIGWRSFWGYFDGFRRPLPMGVYVLLLAFQVVATGGLWRLLRDSLIKRPHVAALLTVLAAYALTIVVVYYAFNWSHFTPQGRYFFPLLLPFGMLTAIGWHAVLDRLGKSDRDRADAIVVGSLVLLNVYLLCVIPSRQAMPGVPAPLPTGSAAKARL